MKVPDVITVFHGEDGLWWWHRKDPQGRLLQGGLEPFVSRWSAKRAARRANRDPYWKWAS